MAGVYIPGLKLPEKGKCMTLWIDGNGKVTRIRSLGAWGVLREYVDELPDLAIGVPDHGRLIDLDAYYERIEQYSKEDGDAPEETEMSLAVLHLFNEQICPVPEIIPPDEGVII